MQTDKFNYSECDYRDSFEYILSDPKNQITTDDLGGIFADPGPRWVRGLMALRNRIAGWFGLKSDVPPDDEMRRVGFFELLVQTDTQMTLGVDDKHLDFRVLLSLSPSDVAGRRGVSVATLVKYNNFLGHIYFFFIKPFHRLIVPIMIKRKLNLLSIHE